MSVSHGSYPIPRDLREDLVKAFGFLQRDNPLKALECMVYMLRRLNMAPVSVQKSISARIQSFLAALSAHPRVRVLLEVTRQKTIPFRHGKERALAIVLDGFCDILREQESVTREARKKEDRKLRQAQIFASGKKYLALGQIRIGAAFFERLLQEFPDDTGYCLEAGQALLDAHLYAEAAAFYRKVVATHERFAQAYSKLLDILLMLEDFSGAEAVFMQALHVFGEHPKTLLRLALFYELCGRNDESLATVERVIALDGTLADAYRLKDRLLLADQDAQSGQKLPSD